MPKLLVKESDLKKYIKKIISEEMNGLLEGKKSFKDPNKFDPEGNVVKGPTGRAGEPTQKTRDVEDLVQRRAGLAGAEHVKSIFNDDFFNNVLGTTGAHPLTHKGGDVEAGKAVAIDYIQNSNIDDRSKINMVKDISRTNNVSRLMMTLYHKKLAYEDPANQVSRVRDVKTDFKRYR